MMDRETDAQASAEDDTPDARSVSMTPHARHVAELVQGVNNTLALMVANGDFAAETADRVSADPSACPRDRTKLEAQFGEVGLALLEAREAARRIRDIVGRLTEASASLLVDLSNPRSTSTETPASRVVVTDDVRQENAALWNILDDQDAFDVVTVREASQRLLAGELFEAIVCVRTRPRSVTLKRYQNVVRLGPTQANRFVLVANDRAVVSKYAARSFSTPLPARPFDPKDLLAILRRLSTRR